MADKTDILLKFWEEQWTQARQCETQRSTMANFIISIYAAGIGIIVVADFAYKALPVAIFLLVMGVFGNLFSAKLFERWRLHQERAIKWSERIDEIEPKAKLIDLFWEAQEKHKSNHPFLNKIALYRLWRLFYYILTGIAIALMALILVG